MRDAVCPAERGARCADYAAARAWWGARLLVPRDRVATYVLMDAERPTSLWAFVGGRSPTDGTAHDVLDSGGVMLTATRRSSPGPVDTNAPRVRVRGHDGTLHHLRGKDPSRTDRLVAWSVVDGDGFVDWTAADDGTRPLDQLVAIVNALDET